MKNLLPFSILLLSATAFAQFDSAIIIDDSPASAGIKKIIAADLNNDNYNEVIVAQAFNIDNVAYYLNNADGSFSSKITIDADIDDPVYIAAGDFNDDGWTDLAIITQTSSQLYVYLNDGEGSFTRQLLDDEFSFGNAMAVADFDGNGSDDIVAIGQHSIDLHRNGGSGSFTKEHILTTDTSPNPLECMSINAADMDNDGDMDLVVGETIGGVIYFNDGSGIFTPEVFTQQFITFLVHAFDANDDGFTDALVQHTTGDVLLYLNNGDGTMAFSTTLFNAPAIRSIQAADTDANGIPDLHFAYTNKARMKANIFATEDIIYEDASLFINEVAIAHLSLGNGENYIWSAAGGTLAYHTNLIFSVPENALAQTVIYPNPAQDYVTLSLPDSLTANMSLYNTLGQKMMEQQLTGTQTLDVSGLATGIYLLEVTNSNTHGSYSVKLVKQ